MAAGGNCDEFVRIQRMMALHTCAPWAPFPLPPAWFPAHQCNGRRTLCQVKRANNINHPVPPAALVTPGLPTARNRTVCDSCDAQGRAMANTDRFLGALPVNIGEVLPSYCRGAETVFRDAGASQLAALGLGVPPHDVQLGAHHVGLLCGLCENLEIQRYWQRRFGGARRQTAARAANTCKCDAHLRKRLCYRDRADYLLDVQRKSWDTAADPFWFSWLRWLQFNPATGRPEYCQDRPHAPARAALQNGRHNDPFREDNACRCGRDIPFRPRAPAAGHFLANGTPTPVAMCTACDGIIVDVAHPRVSGWANMQVIPAMLPVEEQGNLKLKRVVDEVL